MARVGFGPKPVSFISGDDREDWLAHTRRVLNVVAVPGAFLPVIGKPLGLASSVLEVAVEPSLPNLLWLGLDVSAALLAPALPALGGHRHPSALHAFLLGASHHSSPTHSIRKLGRTTRVPTMLRS